MPKRTGDTNEKDDTASKKPKANEHWAMGLLKAMEDPKLLIKSDDSVSVIKDAYPKAEYHYLVLPKTNISNLKALTKDHLDLLKHMEKVAKEIINDDEHKHRTFKLGYHAEASMFRLHLHIISDDMNSACVKTKKHWNSFNTDFFLKSKDVLESLEKNGKIILPSKVTCKEYIDMPLKCHKCEYTPKHMPDLKKHILSHLISSR